MRGLEFRQLDPRPCGRWGFLLFCCGLVSVALLAAPATAAAITCYQDGDGDGYGNAAVSQVIGGATCPAGWSALGTDCDDTRGAAHPGATEVCNGLDDNCVAGIDENNICYTIYYCDADGDGYIGMNISASCLSYQCVPDDCATAPGDDCNDRNRAIHPDAAEVCNNLDDNCIGGVDENNACYVDYYCDADRDGYFSAAISGNCNAYQCLPADCQTEGGTDCNDNLATVHPGATEICNGLDDNCAGGVDEGGSALCDDGVFCNGEEACGGAAGCRAATLSCDDENPCTADSCDESADECVNDPEPLDGEACDDGFWCTVIDVCQSGDCVGGERDCGDGVPCSADFCDEAAQQCQNEVETCAAITIAPDCDAAVWNRVLSVPVVIDEVNGESNLGFTLNFDDTLWRVVGYSLLGGILDGWRETFDCVAGAAPGEVVCAGMSESPLPPAAEATLVKFFLVPQEEPEAFDAAKADRPPVTLAVTDLLADLQFMTADECTLPAGDDDDDDTTDDDDTADDDTTDDDDTVDDDFTPPGDDDNDDATDDDTVDYGEETAVDSGGC